MPLKFISNFVSSFLKRNNNNNNENEQPRSNTTLGTTSGTSTTGTLNTRPKEILIKTSGSQKSSSFTASISFSPTITIQSLWNGSSTKKILDDNSDVTTIKSSNCGDNDKWTLHQEQLTHWQNQPPIFDPFPTFGISDYELLETLGKVLLICC